MPLPVPVSPARLEALAREFGTPLQLYSEAGIRENARELISAFSSCQGFRQFFAVKALPSPAILQILVQEGCGLDCSSTAELHIASLLGVPGDRIMYTSNYTSKKDLEVAFDQGVIINLDDESLVTSLVEARGRCPELISFRLNPGLGRTDSETASNVLGGPSAKFGLPPARAVAAYRSARDAGATRFGIHMMTGSCVMNVEYWRETVAALMDTVAAVHAALGITFEFVNVGGGIGIPYQPTQATVDVTQVAAAIKATLDERISAHALPFTPALAMENGRFMTGPFGWLVTRCEAVKDAFGTRYLGVDACMANLMRPGMYGSYHHITVPAREGGQRALANVVGTLCENNDWFCKERDLPADAGVGDLVVIHDTGAHSHSMGFQYNGKLRAPEVLLRSGPDARAELIRERESVHCLFDNTRIPDDLLPVRNDVAVPFAYKGRAPAPSEATNTFTALAEGLQAKVPASLRPRLQADGGHKFPLLALPVVAAVALLGIAAVGWVSNRRR